MSVTNVKFHGTSTPAFYENGQVWVYDTVAGHFTTCHSLTAGQQARVKRLASR